MLVTLHLAEGQTAKQLIGEVAALSDGPFGSNLKTSHYVAAGPRVIRLQNIGDGFFRDEKAHITQEQLLWLERIRDHVATALGINAEAFGYTPFVEHGGLARAAQVFGDGLGPLLAELNEVLVT